MKPIHSDIITDYPAYSIHAPVDGTTARSKGLPIIKSREVIMVNLGGRQGWSKFSPNSVASYALQYDEDPVAAVEAAKARGHKLKWLSPVAVSISSREVSEKKYYYGYEIGDVVWFEGEAFRLEKTFNHNVRLVPVRAVAATYV